MEKNRLDIWTKDIVAGELDLDRRISLTREELESYKLVMLNKSLEEAQLKSPFYQERLLSVDLRGSNVTRNREELAAEGKSLIRLSSLSEIEKLPFTEPGDLEQAEYLICCIKPDSSTHLTTLSEKGRFGGNTRKVVFTNEELNESSEFFYQGFRSAISAEDRVLILLPSRRPGSAGDLIRRAVEKIGAESVPYGPFNDDILDWGIYLDLLNLEKVTSIVGSAAQIASLAQVAAGRREDRRYRELVSEVEGRLRSVFLGGEPTSQRNYDAIREAWGCSVYEFYSRTEAGMGVAISCGSETEGEALSEDGLLIREADLLLEIIEPESGRVLPEGEEGEIVITTLRRSCTPLIRYRTGDISRILPGDKGKGSVLQRLAPVRK